MTTANTDPNAGAGTAPEAGKAPEAPAPEKKDAAPAPAPKAEEKKAAEGGKAPEKPEEKKPEEKKTGPKIAEVGDAGDIPDDAELVQLSKPALAKRLDRHTKKELRDHFGTDDIGQIKAKLDKAAEYEAAEEQRRREALSEKERLEEDKKKAEERAEKAEKAYQRAVDQQSFAEYDATAKRVFDKYFDEDADTREFVSHKLKKHVLAMDEKEAPTDPKKAEKLFEKWAKDYAEKHPKYAKKAAPPEEAKKIALNTGSDPNRPERAPSNVSKTPKPGQTNSMSKAEYAEYKRQRGLTA